MTEPRPGYLLSPRATILALSGVLLGMLLAALNQTIVATALLIPETPLRRSAREPEPVPAPA